MCGYSLRDAIGLRIAISEAHRVLRKGGRFVIVDLGKPDHGLYVLVWDFISDSYFHSSHILGLKFSALLKTVSLKADLW